MATYRLVSTSFWDDPWVVSLDRDEQYFYLYLLTNSLTNIAGVYQISLKRIVFDTKFTEEEVRGIIKKFEDAGKAFYYKETYIVLPKFPKHQHRNPKVSLGIERCLKNYPC